MHCAAQQVKRKTALAQLVEIYKERGITSTSELAYITGYSERQIWRAKAELTDAGVSSVTDVYVSTDAGVTDADVTTLTRASADIHPFPPKKEIPPPAPPLKKKITPLPLHAGSENFEIEGLNGSTGAMVTQLATAVAGALGNPDFRASREILASNVSTFGPDRVRAAFSEWHAKLLDGAAAPTYRSFTGFCKTVTTFGSHPQPGGLAALLDQREADARKAVPA